MKRLNLIFIVLIAFACLGCKKQNCPGFPAYLIYFPYSKGQELKFINYEDEHMNFIIEVKNTSLPYTLCQGLYDKCACEPPTTSFKTYQNSDSIQIQCFVEFWGNRFLASCEFKYSYEYSDYIYREFTILSDTLTLEGDNGRIVNKVVIVKNKGLVSYTTADGEEWKLVE